MQHRFAVNFGTLSIWNYPSKYRKTASDPPNAHKGKSVILLATREGSERETYRQREGEREGEIKKERERYKERER